MSNENCVYILSNYTRTVVYIGVTADLRKRIRQHQNEQVPGFTKKYRVKYLVYYETYDNILDAIQREKQLKGKTRQKKNALIESLNPKWKDLSIDLF